MNNESILLILKEIISEIVDLEEKKSSAVEKKPSYYSGLSKSTSSKRASHFQKQSAMSHDDPDAYKPAPGDSKETKPSKWNKKFEKMFEDTEENLNESVEVNILDEGLSKKIRDSLKKKAEKANAPLGALVQIYNKGLAAWRTGHRPGASQHAWAMARVNSVLAGGPARKVDAAQWKKIQKHRSKN